MTDTQRTRVEVPYANGGKVGHFILEDAERFEEAVHGDHSLSVNTGTSREHHRLYRTAGGQWVRYSYSDHEHPRPRYHFLSPDQAKGWLYTNQYAHVVLAHFDPDPEESGPYFENSAVSVSLGNLTGPVSAFAEKLYSDPKRHADAVRALVAIGLEVTNGKGRL